MLQLEKTPPTLGYRMPAEWEPHAATWLSWPRREGISFPGAFDRVMPVFRKMVEALLSSEPVCINVCNGAHEAEACQVLEGLPFDRLTFHRIPTNEPWCRDHGPIFLTRRRRETTPGDCRLGLQCLGRQVSAVRSRRSRSDPRGRDPRCAGLLSAHDSRRRFDRGERRRGVAHLGRRVC